MMSNGRHPDKLIFLIAYALQAFQPPHKTSRPVGEEPGSARTALRSWLMRCKKGGLHRSGIDGFGAQLYLLRAMLVLIGAGEAVAYAGLRYDGSREGRSQLEAQLPDVDP